VAVGRRGHCYQRLARLRAFDVADHLLGAEVVMAKHFAQVELRGM